MLHLHAVSCVDSCVSVCVPMAVSCHSFSVCLVVVQYRLVALMGWQSDGVHSTVGLMHCSDMAVLP